VKHFFDTVTKHLVEKIVLREKDVTQHVFYFYDAAGHLAFQDDRADQAIFFRGKKVPAKMEFTYDSAYRLIEASGREHIGQTKGRAFSSEKRGASKQCGNGLAAKDGAAVARYVESYKYDLAGNMQKLRHCISDDKNHGWSRYFEYKSPSYIDSGSYNNRLTMSRVGDVGSVEEKYEYDEHGNMRSMPVVVATKWDYTNHLKSTISERSNAPSKVVW